MPPRRAAREQGVRYNSRQRRFEYHSANGTRTILRGVRPTLQTLAWPNYSYDRATVGRVPPEYKVAVTETKSASASGAVDSKRQRRRPMQPHTARQGTQRGSRVDKQISKICNWIGRYHEDGLTVKTFTVPRTRVPTSIAPRTRNSILLLRRKLHPYTLSILTYMANTNWIPIGAQVPVGSHTHRIGTAIDVLCVYPHSRSRFVVLEIKCGFDRYYYHHTRTRMNPPFQAFDDSCYFQHQLQLMTTVWLLEQCPTHIRSEAYVLRAHRAGVTAYPLRSQLRSSPYTTALHRMFRAPARAP